MLTAIGVEFPFTGHLLGLSLLITSHSIIGFDFAICFEPAPQSPPQQAAAEGKVPALIYVHKLARRTSNVDICDKFKYSYPVRGERGADDKSSIHPGGLKSFSITRLTHGGELVPRLGRRMHAKYLLGKY